MSGSKESILKAIVFIEENLQSPVSIPEAASAAGYSLYHFIRLFEGFTGHTPKDYILRRRIAEAAAELKSGSRRIIDICFDYQFGSPEAFSRAFRKIAGISPAEYRSRDYYPDKSFLSRIENERIIHTGNILETPVTEIFLDSFLLSGVTSLVRDDKSVIADLWRLTAEQFRPEPCNPDNEYLGLSFWPEKTDIGGFFYMCGQRTADLDGIADTACVKKVQACNYLRFVHKGSPESLSVTYKYIFETFLHKNSYVLDKSWDLEIYRSSEETEILIPFS